MATNSTRDVRVRIDVEADASEAQSLTAQLREMAKAGGSAAPEFQRLADELDASSAATKALRESEQKLQSDTNATRVSLQAKRDALRLSNIETDTATKRTAEHRAAVKAAQLAILQEEQALRTQREALKQASAEARNAAAAEKALADQMRATAAAAKASGQQQAVSNKTTADGLQVIAGQLRTVQQAAAALVGGQLLGGLAADVGKTADAYSNLAARIKFTTGEGEAFTSALSGVFEVAQRTGTSLDTVGDLFNKLAAAGKQIGLSNTQALALTETIAQATQLSGASADSANAALVQLVQGLQSGTLRGEELNSVLEQAPRLAKALADGLGVTTGELRKLGEAGSLTSTQVINALQGQSAALRAEFDQLPQTIGRSITNLSTAWTQYVGEVDKASGASATVAAAINSLARNLDTVASVLISVGKATAAYQALKLAQTFLGIGTAARGAAADVAALAASQQAAATSGVGAAAGASRFAAALSSIKAFALVAVLTNLKEIGTWIGEGVAKWQGYGQAIADAEGRMRAQEAAARSLAEGNAALAQQAAIAADKALGLGVEAQALVGTFEKARAAGDTVADSLGKVAKALDLSNVQGINAAGAALDALAVRSKITGDQLRDALAGALKTEDLGKFRTEAAAAFDGSEAGARRLAAAVDALGEESLRRAGLSAAELRTGFGAAAASAINDVDALAATLDRLGAKGPEAGAALARSLDKATEAAGTERALQGVIDRLTEFGRTGRLSGEQVAAGMEKAREKIDALLPGVSTLDEALRNFGLRTSAELDATATKFAASWAAIRSSTTTSLADKVKAFEQYAEAATAANKGVETAEIRVQREMLRMQQIAADTGDAYVRHMGRAREAVSSVPGVIGPNQDVKSSIEKTGPNAVDASLQFELRKKMDAGTLTTDDLPAIRAVIASLQQQNEVNGSASRMSAGFQSTGGAADAQAWQQVRGRLQSEEKRLERTVNINMGGRRTPVRVASAEDSDALVGVLRQLETASGTAS